MSRSKWKGSFVCYSLYKKYLFLKKAKINNFINIYNRSSVILNEFVGGHFKVYNGLKLINVFGTENKVGCKFGEFSFTRIVRRSIHLKKEVKKNKNKK